MINKNMNIEALTSMLSNKTGMQKSMASTIMNVVLNYAMKHFMQKGLIGNNILGAAGIGGGSNPTTTPSSTLLSSSSSLSSSSPSPASSLQSALSQLMSSSSNDPSHPLVQEVKNKGGLRDDNQAKQYTQQAISVLQEHANNDSQGFNSLIGSFLGGREKGKERGGGLDDVVGGLLGG